MRNGAWTLSSRSFRYVNSVIQFSAHEMKKKPLVGGNWTTATEKNLHVGFGDLSGCAAGVRALVVDDHALTSPVESILNGRRCPASLGDISIGSTPDISSSLRSARCRSDYRDCGIRSAMFARCVAS